MAHFTRGATVRSSDSAAVHASAVRAGMALSGRKRIKAAGVGHSLGDGFSFLSQLACLDSRGRSRGKRRPGGGCPRCRQTAVALDSAFRLDWAGSFYGDISIHLIHLDAQGSDPAEHLARALAYAQLLANGVWPSAASNRLPRLGLLGKSDRLDSAQQHISGLVGARRSAWFLSSLVSAGLDMAEQSESPVVIVHVDGVLVVLFRNAGSNRLRAVLAYRSESTEEAC